MKKYIHRNNTQKWITHAQTYPRGNKTTTGQDTRTQDVDCQTDWSSGLSGLTTRPAIHRTWTVRTTSPRSVTNQTKAHVTWVQWWHHGRTTEGTVRRAGILRNCTCNCCTWVWGSLLCWPICPQTVFVRVDPFFRCTQWRIQSQSSGGAIWPNETPWSIRPPRYLLTCSSIDSRITPSQLPSLSGERSEPRKIYIYLA